MILPIATTDKVPYLHTKIAVMRWLILLIFTGCSFGVKAQYQSFFGDSSTYWTSVGSGLQRVNEWTDSIVYRKDTVFEGLSYKIVSYWRGYPDNFYNSDFLLREDTTNGKLWRRYFSDSLDELMADISLNVGDQFLMPISQLSAIVDSVYYLNSRKHVRLNSGFQSIPVEFIEGVGPSCSFFWKSVMLCQYKDNLPNYVLNAPKYPSVCNVYQLNVDELTSKEGITIYPNPASGFVKIKTNTLKQVSRISINDVLGRLVATKDVHPHDDLELNVEKLSRGTYVLLLFDSDNAVLKAERLILR